jgi:hypothetical protein
MRRGHLFWPVVLIVVGSVWLLDNLGIINVSIWAIIVPVGLIALGISILLGSIGSTRVSETETLSIPLEGVEKARVHFNYGAGRITLKAGTQSGELLSGKFGDGVRHRVKHEDAALDVQLDMPAVFGFPFDWSSRQRQWAVDLNNNVPLKLAFDIGAVEARLDLTELCVTDIDLNTGASSTDLRLPAKSGHTRVRVGAGAASINIHVPEGVAARIRSDSALADFKVDTNRFPRRERVYESPDYENAENKVDIKVEMGVGSVRVLSA